jgi:hypothetical protein
MDDKDLKQLTDLAKSKIKTGISKESALKSFISAGILNKKGEFTKPYKNLEYLIVQTS